MEKRNDGGGDVMAMQELGVAKKAAVGFVILALLPIALPSFCLLSLLLLCLAFPLSLLALIFLLFRKAFLRSSSVVSAAEDNTLVSNYAPAASEEVRAANGLNGQGVKIEASAPETQSKTSTHAETHEGNEEGNGKDNVHETDWSSSKLGVDRHSPKSHSHPPGARVGNYEEPVPVEASPSSNSPISKSSGHQMTSEQTLPALNDRAESASLEPVSEVVHEPLTEKHLEATSTEADVEGIAANDDYQYGLSSSPAQSNEEVAATASAPVMGVTPIDHKKKAKPHHHHHHHKHPHHQYHPKS